MLATIYLRVKLMLICISQHVPHGCVQNHAQYANSFSCFYESIFLFFKGNIVNSTQVLSLVFDLEKDVYAQND